MEGVGGGGGGGGGNLSVGLPDLSWSSLHLLADLAKLRALLLISGRQSSRSALCWQAPAQRDEVCCQCRTRLTGKFLPPIRSAQLHLMEKIIIWR